MTDRVRVSERAGGDARCPYCHDALGEALATAACDGCDLVAHAECWAALVKCPTIGCGRQAPSPPPAPPTSFTVGKTTTVTPPPLTPTPASTGQRAPRRDRRRPAPTSLPGAPTHPSESGPLDVAVLAVVVLCVGVFVWFLNTKGFAGYDQTTSQVIIVAAAFMVFAVAALAVVGFAIWRHLRRPPR